MYDRKRGLTAVDDVDVHIVIIVLVALIGGVPAVRLCRRRVLRPVDGEVLHEPAQRVVLHRLQVLLALRTRTLQLGEVVSAGG